MKKQKKKNYIIFIGLLLFTCLLIYSYSDKEKNIGLTPIISKLENGNYYIFGANKDCFFEIEKTDNYSFEIKDEDDKVILPIIETKEDKIIIKAPKDLYEDGKTYILTIENTSFVNKDLKEANIVEFSIVRKASNSYKYKDNINKVSSNEINIVDNVLSTKNKYNVNDIIVLEDDNIKGLYRVLKVNDNNTYEVDSAQLDEVFSEFDYYKSEFVDLSNFENNKELQAYMLYNVKKTILEYFVDNVNAEPKLKITVSKYNKKTGKITFKVEATTEAGDKFFNINFLDNHDMKLTFEVSVGLKVHSDISLTRYDVALEFEIDVNPKFEIASRNEFIKQLKKIVDNQTKDGNYVDSWLNLVDIQDDEIKSNLEFGKIAVPTTVPGVYITVNTSMLYELDLKASFEVDSNANILLNIGIRTPKTNKQSAIYGSIKSNGDMKVNAGGKFETKLGLKTTAGIEFVNLIALTGNIKTGIYTDGLVYVNLEDEGSEVLPKLETNIEAGLFDEVNVNARIYKMDFNKKLYDVKVPLLKINEVIELKKETSPVIKEEENADKYLLSLYGFGSCSGEFGAPPTVELMNTYEIKAGGIISDNKEFMNNPSIVELSYYGDINEDEYHYGIYTYTDFLTYMDEVKKTYNSYKTCQKKCINENGEENSYTCILDKCQIYDSYNVKLPKIFDLNHKIDKDINLVVGPIGCGDQ